jgi:hypothetical protein
VSATATMDRSDGPRLVGTSTAAPSSSVDAVSLDNLPETVLEAIREIRAVRYRYVRALSSGDRRLLAAAEHLDARHIDLQAQVDASGRDRPSG